MYQHCSVDLKISQTFEILHFGLAVNDAATHYQMLNVGHIEFSHSRKIRHFNAKLSFDVRKMMGGKMLLRRRKKKTFISNSISNSR